MGFIGCGVMDVSVSDDRTKFGSYSVWSERGRINISLDTGIPKTCFVTIKENGREQRYTVRDWDMVNIWMALSPYDPVTICKARYEPLDGMDAYTRQDTVDLVKRES